jgi:hypothetical protein
MPTMVNWGRAKKRVADMTKLAIVFALLLAASPVAAQSQQQQPLGAGGQTNNSPLTDTGVICLQEMVATFCNVPTGPNHSGFGSSGAGAASSSGTGSAGSTMTSIPPCAALGPADELCN